MPRRAKGEGTTYYDIPHKRFIGEVTIDGKTRRVTGKSKAEARTKLRRLLLDIAEKRASITPDRQKVGQYLKAWVNTLDLAPSTTLRYSSLLEHILSHEFANAKISDLESQHILNLYSELKKTKSESTVKKIHTMLHTAFEAARHTRKGVFRNPCDLPKNQRPKYKPKEQGCPFGSLKEEAFLQAVKGDDLEALYVLALDSGMRQGELFALEWRHVNWANKSVEVQQTLKDTKNGLIVGETKNRQRRSIRLSPTTMQALEQHKKAQLKKNGIKHLVFPDRIGGFMRRQNFNRRDFAHALKRAAEASTLDFSTHSFHDLRHTCASLLLAEGEAITRVSQRLGHATVKTTLEVYAHAIPQDEERPAVRFEQRRRSSGNTSG
jgi:integrase